MGGKGSTEQKELSPHKLTQHAPSGTRSSVQGHTTHTYTHITHSYTVFQGLPALASAQVSNSAVLRDRAWIVLLADSPLREGTEEGGVWHLPQGELESASVGWAWQRQATQIQSPQQGSGGRWFIQPASPTGMGRRSEMSWDIKPSA